MLWMNVHTMSERDAQALYAYLKHVGPKGKAMPENVPPGQEPNVQHIEMTLQNTGATPAADS